MKKQNSFVVKKHKILIVDDDSILRSEFKDCFDEYDVQEAVNGDEAVKVLSGAHDIDLVILDLRMPGLNGLEVLKVIKKDEREVPVIMFTGFGTKETVIEAMRFRAEDFIEKPFDIEETRRVIEKALAKKAGEPEPDSLDIKGKMEKVKRFLELNYMKKADLNHAAKVVSLSPKYLSRAFKESVGTGFNEYRQLLRIENSKKLLKGTGYNVDQISYKMGYENSESFIRQFKKHTGKTPSGFRKSSKK